MRRWGRVPIFKTFIPDHELGIQTHTTLPRKEREDLYKLYRMRGSEGKIGDPRDLFVKHIVKALCSI
jgi:hypothetical protein